jgi:hypothetical protein
VRSLLKTQGIARAYVKLSTQVNLGQSEPAACTHQRCAEGGNPSAAKAESWKRPSSVQSNPEGSESTEGLPEEVEQPWLVNLLGQPVILNYTRGPFPESPWRIEKGPLDARAGLFILTEVSDWGLVARKIMEDG